MEITFEQLPSAVSQLFDKLENIERLLMGNSNQPQPDTDHWLNLTELCEYLPDKPVKPTVYGWVHHRVIPCHRRGKKLYFLKSEIDTWLKAGRKKTI
ncbi:MAG TPA: helix-turn-helix domain-containing protein, partial [Chitinophagaceae bacterium]|nr:helix-turn-helix domain-containing protein [Chitinophagaceae bacterium]